MDVYLFPIFAGFDGVQDFDVKVLQWKHLVAGSTDVVFHEEIGSDIAGVGRLYVRNQFPSDFIEIALRNKMRASRSASSFRTVESGTCSVGSSGIPFMRASEITSRTTFF